jgi:hypothetical protein
MHSLLNKFTGSLLGLTLLCSSCSSPAAQQESGAAAMEAAVRPPVVWLIGQDDYPLVSRRLMLSTSVDSAARTVLEPLLYCFDAADHQSVQRAGDELLLNGPVRDSRAAPNVGMPLQLLDLETASLQLVEQQSQSFAVSPDGSLLLTWDNFHLDLRQLPNESLPEGKLIQRLDEESLGAAQISTALWLPDGESFLMQISNYDHGGLKAGVWEFPLDGEPLFLGFLSGRVLQVLGSQTLLHSIPTPRQHYQARQLLRSYFHLSSVKPGQFKTEQLHDDLMYTEAVSARPNSSDFVYARHSDKALVLRSEQDGTEQETVLWQSTRSIEDLSWSADGRWLCFTDRTEDQQRRIIVIDSETGALEDLGQGIRPVFTDR